MEPKPQRPIPRRFFLAGAALGAVALSVPAFGQAAYAASSAGATADGWQTLPPFFDLSRTTRYSWISAASVLVSGLSSTVKIESATIHYDERVYAATTFGRVISGASLHRRKTSATRLAAHERTVALDVSSITASAAGTVQLLVPLEPIDLFPNDTVDSPIASRIVVVVIDGARRRNLKLDLVQTATATATKPWAVKTAVAWVDAASGPDGVYRAPSAIRVESVGPESIPAGLKVGISFDPTAVSGASVSGYLEQDAAAVSTVTAAASAATLALTLPSAIPVGDSRTIFLTWAGLAPVAGASAVIVEVNGQDDTATPRRNDVALQSLIDQSLVANDVTKIGG